MRDILEKRDKLIPIAIAFCIAFVGLSILFLNYSRGLNEQEICAYTMDAAEQSKNTILKQITGDFQTLDGIAKLIGSMDVVDYDALMPTLESVNNENNFIRMGFTDRTGITHGVDIEGIPYTNVNLRDKGFVEKAYDGQKVITKTQTAKIGDFYVNYYAVPIIRNGVVENVLCAVNKADTLRNILDTSMFGGKGFVHIIDSDGKFVIRSIHPSVDSDALSIYEHYKLDSETKDRLEADLLEGNAGTTTYPFENEGRWAAYTPIGINDWYVFCVVPKDEVNRNYIQMSIGIIGIIIGASLIFLFFLLYIKMLNDRRRRELEKIAFVDPLTGCRNEQKFLRDGMEMINGNPHKKYAVIYSDIKNFKYVNDLFGYDVGDGLLRYWADTLSNLMREGEIFARLTIDHFVSLHSYETKEELEQIFSAAASRLQEYPKIKERKFNLELYAGIYLINGADNRLTLRDMLNRANVAEKSIKNSGKSSFVYYSKEMRDKYLQEIEMESHMEEALQQEEFKLFLQPKIAIGYDNRLFGAEALVRWDRPDSGLLPPAVFIPLFERNGFIVHLDRYMFESSCRFYRDNVASVDGEFTISVNVSRKGLWQSDFVEWYTETKKRYGVPDGCMELEFTEDFVIEDKEMFIDTVRQLHENGFLCSLDDFGAGQSSLNVLKDIPVDILKLDMLFFRGEQQSERGWKLVKSIIGMAKALSMKTVSEGVESSEQVTTLKKLGCDYIQGYVFSKPLSEKGFIDFADRWRQAKKQNE